MIIIYIFEYYYNKEWIELRNMKIKIIIKEAQRR